MNKNINTPSFWNYRNFKNVNELSQSKIYKHKHKLVLKWLGTKTNKLLNIGVGNGYLEKLLSVKRKSIHLSGLDISDLSIKKASFQFKGTFKIGNVTKIPFKDGSFDSVTILDVLEHLNSAELDKGFKEITRVLKNKGTLILSVPLNEKESDKQANRHLTSFSRTSMQSLLVKNKFMVNETRELFAFRRLYWFKTIIATLFNIKQPNLLVVKATKNSL